MFCAAFSRPLRKVLKKWEDKGLVPTALFACYDDVCAFMPPRCANALTKDLKQQQERWDSS